MSNAVLALIGGGAVIAFILSLKAKIEKLENQIRILTSRVSDLVGENTFLQNTVRQKDSVISQKDSEIAELTEQITKNLGKK